jgi:hypothetical protein
MLRFFWLTDFRHTSPKSMVGGPAKGGVYGSIKFMYFQITVYYGLDKKECM